MLEFRTWLRYRLEWRVDVHDDGSWELVPEWRERGAVMRLQCWLGNRLDPRVIFCECHYEPPYGRVIMGGCAWHD